MKKRETIASFLFRVRVHARSLLSAFLCLVMPGLGHAQDDIIPVPPLEATAEETIRELAQLTLDEGAISQCNGGCGGGMGGPGGYGQPPMGGMGPGPGPGGHIPGEGGALFSITGGDQPPQGMMPPQQQQPLQQQAPHLYQSAHTPALSEHKLLHHSAKCPAEEPGFTVNFEDISVVQLINFISKISCKNFIYNSNDLRGADGRPLAVTIVSHDATSVENLSAALLQVLKMNDLSLVEQGNNVLIYKNPNMSKVSTVITNDNLSDACKNAIITRVFQLFYIDADKLAGIVRTLVSPEANVEPSSETRHLIVTDITANVNKIADLIAALDTPNLSLDVAEYQVVNADPQCLADYAREILTPLAGNTQLTITPESTSQSIFIVSSPFVIEKARSILQSLDVPQISCLQPVMDSQILENNTFYMYKLKYHSGQEIAFALHEIGTNLQYTGVSNIDFVNTIFSIQWLEVNNSLVFAGTDDSIAKVVELIEELDTLPKQVYLEVLILDTTLRNSLDFGVQWIALGDEQNKLAFATGLLAQTPPAANLQTNARFVASNPPNNPPLIPNPGRDVPLPVPGSLSGILDSTLTEAFGFGIVGNILSHQGRSFLTLGALISALDEEGDSTIVLNPRLMVENNQPADFFVGQNIPYQTTSTVIQQTGSVTQNIQYEDIGVELQITPTIAPDNMVTLQINQTVAEVVFGTVSSLTPVTNKALVTTRIHMPSGTFLVMSGQVRDEIEYIRSGIPCLGTLPLIGPAFSRTIEARQKRNLIFFVRPTVITTAEGGVRFTDLEGYRHNWETDPCWILDNPIYEAPENQIYPMPPELQY